MDVIFLVANTGLWSNTLARYSRHQHSVSLLHLSELDFWKSTCAEKCSECTKQSTINFQTHHDHVHTECSRLASASDTVTEHWKRPRLENCSKSSAGNASFKARFGQVPRLCLMFRARIVEFSINWQSDSGTFMNALVHWSIVSRRAMSLAKQTRV